jgi:hypothetical protein
LARQNDLAFDASADELATELTVAQLGKSDNGINADAVPALVQRMHDTILDLAAGAPDGNADQVSARGYTPAASIR